MDSMSTVAASPTLRIHSEPSPTRDGRERSFLVITSDFRPVTGGVAEYLHNLWDEVAKVHRVEVLSTVDPAGAAWEHRYELRHTPTRPPATSGSRKISSFRYYLALRRFWKDTADDLVERRRSGHETEVYIGIWSPRTRYAITALRRAGIEYRIHAYGFEMLHPFRGAPRWILDRNRRDDFRAASEVIAVSCATAELAREKYGADLRTSVVNPGIDGPHPDSEAIRTRARQLRSELDLDGNQAILSIGRLVRRKGFDCMLRVMAELVKDVPDLVYLIAGDGPLRPELERIIEEDGLSRHVRILGSVDETTKWALYESSHVFAMPNSTGGGSDFEGFGIVFLEAALVGVPAVAGRSGGVGDAVVDGVTGILVEPDRPAALLDAVRRLLLDDELRRRMGTAARARVEADFGWSRMAGELIDRGHGSAAA